MSHAGIRDLRWWACLSSNPYLGRELWPRPEAIVYIDASMSGWGAAWKGLVPAAGFFDATHEGAHINELEVLAALYALKHFVRHARRRSVEIITDSMVTMHVVRNLTSRSLRLLSRLRELRALCEMEAVTISTRHIPPVLNTWADRLSRRRDSHAWSIPTPAVRLLERRFSPTLSVTDGNELPSYTQRNNCPYYHGQPCSQCGPGISVGSGVESLSVRNGMGNSGTRALSTTV